MLNKNNTIDNIISIINSADIDNFWVSLSIRIDKPKLNEIRIIDGYLGLDSSIVRVLNIENNNCFVIGLSIPKNRINKKGIIKIKEAFEVKEKEIFSKNIFVVDDKMQIEQMNITKELLISFIKSTYLKSLMRLPLSKYVFNLAHSEYKGNYFNTIEAAYKYKLEEINSLILRKEEEVRNFVHKINKTQQSIFKISQSQVIDSSKTEIKNFLLKDISDFSTKAMDLINSIEEENVKKETLKNNYNELLNKKSL